MLSDFHISSSSEKVRKKLFKRFAPYEPKLSDNISRENEVFFNRDLLANTVSQANRETADSHVVYEFAIFIKSIRDEFSWLGEVHRVRHHCSQGS